MFLTSPAARGNGVIIFNVLRIFTTITLLLAFAALVLIEVGMVKRSMGFYVFDVVSLVPSLALCIFLIFSEWPFETFLNTKQLFRRFWPLFSDKHGLTGLGLSLVFIGCTLLGRLNNAQKKNFTPAFRNLVLASGILCLIFGFSNMFLSLLYHDRHGHIYARNVRSKGSLAERTPQDQLSMLDDKYSYRSKSIKSEAPTHRSKSIKSEAPHVTFWNRFFGGEQEATAAPRPPISGPINHTPMPMPATPPPYNTDIEHDAGARSDSLYFNQYSHDQLDGDSRRSPIADVQRPDTALHPMNYKHHDPHASSQYSAAHMSVFV